MKKYLFISIIAIIAISCQKEPIALFDTGDSGVLFPGLGDGATYKGYNSADKTYYINKSFVSIPLGEEKMVVDFPVRVSGKESEKERIVSYSVIADKSTAVAGTHYKILEAKIPAGERYGYIRFELYRSQDLDNSSVKVSLELLNSDVLKVGSNEYKLGTLTWTNQLPMFPNSANYIRTYNMILLSPLAKTSAVNSYYSTNAHKAILDALNWPVEYWPAYNNALADPTTGVSPMFGAYYSDLYAKKLQEYLDAYAAANNGVRLKHNDGLAKGVAIQARVTGVIYNPNL